ncbi:MAG: AAA family ATPase, partial [Methylomonas sp.]
MTIEHLELGIAQGWLQPLDRAFVQFLNRQSPNADQIVLLAAALLSQQLAKGAVYLDLQALSQDPVQTLAVAESVDLGWLKQYQLKDWLQGLIEADDLVATGEGNTPLVLDFQHKRLYLRRYWQYQQIVTQVIDRLVKPIRDSLPEQVKAEIAGLFPVQNSLATDWQKIACVVALRAKFSIITGGPGTGKTTTLTKLLAVLIKMASADASLG